MRKILLLFVLCSFTALAQEEARRITETLCSPEFHGRGYVNRGDSIAAAFLAEEFQKLGLKPLGKSYFQPFELGVNTFPGKMELAQDGIALRPGVDFVVDPSSRGTERTLFEMVDVPSGFYWDKDRMIALLRELIADNQNGKSKMLVCNTTVFSGDSLKEVQATIREIAQIVPLMELVNGKFTWSVGRAQSEVLHVLVQTTALSKHTTVEVEIDAEFIEHYPSQNVAAQWSPRAKCKETIVFTAHYDHLGRMGQEAYFPGANDNASGTAMLFEMARRFKELSLNYNLVFIAFAGEEAGLVGSQYFVEHPLLKLDKIKFLINLDIMGSGEEGITVVNATNFESQCALLESINTELNLLTKIKRRGPTANSDHYWFTQKGVPAFFIYTMGPNKHYHDVEDTYAELSFSEFNDIATLLVEFVQRLQSQ
jgi:hypothetical protein